MEIIKWKKMVLLALFSLICCAFNQKKQLNTITHKDTLLFLIGKGLSQTDYPIWIFLRNSCYYSP